MWFHESCSLMTLVSGVGRRGPHQEVQIAPWRLGGEGSVHRCYVHMLGRGRLPRSLKGSAFPWRPVCCRTEHGLY